MSELIMTSILKTDNSFYLGLTKPNCRIAVHAAQIGPRPAFFPQRGGDPPGASGGAPSTAHTPAVSLTRRQAGEDYLASRPVTELPGIWRFCVHDAGGLTAGEPPKHRGIGGTDEGPHYATMIRPSRSSGTVPAKMRTTAPESSANGNVSRGHRTVLAARAGSRSV